MPQREESWDAGRVPKMSGKPGQKHRNHLAPAGKRWCGSCQRFLPERHFYWNASEGFLAGCKKCRSDRGKEQRAAQSLFENLVQRYRSKRAQAKFHNIFFDLTFEQWLRRRSDRCLVCQALGVDCTACSDTDALREVDRINSDPKVGYRWANTQSLCTTHNIQKHGAMVTEQLWESIKRDPARFTQCGNCNSRNRPKPPARKRMANSRPAPVFVQKKLDFPAPPQEPKPPAPTRMPTLFDKLGS